MEQNFDEFHCCPGSGRDRADFCSSQERAWLGLEITLYRLTSFSIQGKHGVDGLDSMVSILHVDHLCLSLVHFCY